MIGEHVIQNAVSDLSDTLAPSAKLAEQQRFDTPDKRFDERYDKVEEGRGRTTTIELADATPKYAPDLNARHISEGDNVPKVVHWYGYSPAVTRSNCPNTFPNNLLFASGEY